MVLVIKIGGSVLKEELRRDFIDDLKDILPHEKVVLVHGGGREVTRIATRLGKEQRFVVSPEGFRSRYTDEETAEIFTMVMAGKVNKEITARLLKEYIPAIGISGLDGGLIRAKRKKRLIVIDERGRKKVIEGGYTGKITEVRADMLNLLLEKEFLPVIAPVALGTDFEYLNVDGDRAAAYIAGSLGAKSLVFLTDVPGIFVEGRTVREIEEADIDDILPKIGPGMKTKLYAAMEALSMEVEEAIIASALEEHSLARALAHEIGTVIHR